MKKTHALLLVTCFCMYIAYALYVNIFGTNASVMMGFFGISSVEQGFLLTMQSVGGLLMAVFLALFGERYNKITVLCLGLLVLAAACLGVGLAQSYTVVMVCVLLAGVGYTNIDVMMNGMVSDIFPQRKNTFLPLIHAFYGLGAMLAPLFASALVREDESGSFRIPYLIIAVAAFAIFAVSFFVGKAVRKDTPYADLTALRQRARANPAEVFRSGKAWLLLLCGTLYFSFLMGTASWLPTYYLQSFGMSLTQAGMMLTLFFAGALVMRFLSPLLLRKLNAMQLFACFGAGAGVAMLCALHTLDPTLAGALIALAGFLQGGNVAAFVILCCDAFPHRTASASSIMIFASSAATMTAPLWMGALSQQSGSFQLPLSIVCILLFCSCLLAWRITSVKKTR